MDPVFIQFLSAIPVLRYFAEFYREVIPEADVRTGKWMLMSSPDIPVSIVLAYLCTVIFVGPCLMRYLKIPRVKELLVVYNSLVLALNLVLGISFTWHILGAGYQFGCQKVGKPEKHESAIATLLWIFHSSKIAELIDTVFLVLKKKGNQLTFLHLYHHSTIVVATWIGVKFVPGGSSAVIAMVNSWIHVFMYFYYEMMVLGVKSFRNYKKFVTIMQIVQFLATIVLCTTALRKDCGYPRWILIWLLLYMISFLVLFIHFYVQTYWKPKGNSGAAPLAIEDKLETTEVETPGENLTNYNNSTLPIFSDDDEPETDENERTTPRKGKRFRVKRDSEAAPPHPNELPKFDGNKLFAKQQNGSSHYVVTTDDEMLSSDDEFSSDSENEDGTASKTCTAAVTAVVASSTSDRLCNQRNDTLVLN